MFVEIVKPKSAIVVDVYIKQSRAAGFTEWHALSVLEQTCHFGNIKTMLKIINGCSEAEQKKFKSAVIAMVDGRENSPSNFETLKSLAVKGGYLEEFLEADNKDKIYEYTGIKCFHANSVNDVVGDLASEYDMLYCNFEEDFSVKLWCNLPKICNFSQCNEVDLRKMNLEDVKFIKFKEGAKVDLSFAQNLPKSLDVSYLDEICLDSCNLATLGELKFRKAARVDLDEASNLPSDIDFSPCDYVYLRGANLSGLSNISFGRDARVKLDGALNLPKYIDVSRCKKVKFENADVSKVEKIIFRDEEQMQKSLFNQDNFNGKIVFTMSVLNKENGMEKY